AEDGIRDRNVTGVQTCALPISQSGNRAVECRNAELERRIQIGKRLTVRVVKMSGQRFERHAFADGTDQLLRLPRSSGADRVAERDRKSTRLNSSHDSISYAVFC